MTTRVGKKCYTETDLQKIAQISVQCFVQQAVHKTVQVKNGSNAEIRADEFAETCAVIRAEAYAEYFAVTRAEGVQMLVQNLVQ